jgi:tetratricopeptide (TPR) repeat protein
LYRKALDLTERRYPADSPKMARALSDLARWLLSVDRAAESEPLYRRALAIDRAHFAADAPVLAADMHNLALALDGMDRHAQAERLFRDALALDAALPGNDPDRVPTLNELGALLLATGNGDEAESLHRQALRIAELSGEPQPLWSTQGYLADLYAARGQLSLAIFFGKQAVNGLQAVRRDLTQTEQATQQAFVRSREYYYRDLADWLITAGRLPEASQVIEMLKEQEFHGFLRRDPDTDPRRTLAAYDAFESAQLDTYQAQRGDLARITAELHELSALDPFDLTAEQESRLRTLDAARQAAYRGFQHALDSIKAGFAELGTARRDRLAQRQLLQGKDDRGLVRDLGDGVALLHTLVLPQRVHLLLTLPEIVLSRQSAVGEAEINQQVQRLRQALSDPSRDPRPAAEVLYGYLIAPIADVLEAAGVETLMVSLDGALRYIPLGSLYDGEHYLIERF